MEQTLRVAAYMRLSKADETAQTESNSISMQRLLIREYVDAHFADCQITEYQDDGYTGTHFLRPGIQRLLEDARGGRLDCIVVKDFSRFGRNYLEVGDYLEQIFPFLGIRFISINDRYDSAVSAKAGSDLTVNFKNLLCDLYSKDISQKVKSSLLAKKESGQYISANAPFGYEKAADDRHMLVICEEEAAVVRKIFALAVKGVTSTQTARKLNQEHIPTPMEFKSRKGGTVRPPKGGRFCWSGSTVCSILRNPVYAGDIAYGKTEKDQVGGRSILKARANWQIILDHHAPIVAREIFDEVQKSRGVSRGRKTAGNSNPLAGRVVCGCCERSLRIVEGRSPYFTCGNRYVTGRQACVGKASVLSVERVVRQRLSSYLEERGIAAEDICGHDDDSWARRAKLLAKQKQAQTKYDRLKREQYERYERYAKDGGKEFNSLQLKIEKQRQVIRELREQIVETEEQIQAFPHEKLSSGKDVMLTAEKVGRYLKEVVIYSEEEIVVRGKE